MSSSVMPPPAASINGAPPIDPLTPVLAARSRRSADDRAQRSPLLAKLTGLTSIATRRRGRHPRRRARRARRRQLCEERRARSARPAEDLLPRRRQPRAAPGHQAVRRPATRKRLAGEGVREQVHQRAPLEIAGGQTYAQVSAAAIAAPTNAKLAEEKATLFQGETLRSILLSAWGWSLVGTIATLAGLLLIVLGAILLLLPLANWQINLRGRRVAGAAA